VIHVYAITDRCGPPLTVTGIGGVPVELVSGGFAAAVVSRHDSAPEPTAESVWRHELVVEAVMTDRSVLPARFGRGLADVTELADLLGNAGQVAALDRVRDAIELAVRVVAPEAPGNTADAETTTSTLPEQTGPGREHLRRLAAIRSVGSSRLAAAQAAGRLVEARLSALARASVVRPASSSGRVAMHAAFLVPRDRLAAFQDEVGAVARELAEGETGAALLCTGPWPPYSFVAWTDTAVAHEEAIP
jgi:hypothetical protein